MSGKIITVGINGHSTVINKEIDLNSAESTIHIQTNVKQISIFNADWKLVYTGKELVISVAHFPNGLYYVIGTTDRVKSGNK